MFTSSYLLLPVIYHCFTLQFCARRPLKVRFNLKIPAEVVVFFGLYCLTLCFYPLILIRYDIDSSRAATRPYFSVHVKQQHYCIITVLS